MSERKRKAIVKAFKSIKLEKGAILSDKLVDEIKLAAMQLSDDDLLFKISERFGCFCALIGNPDDVMAAYGTCVGAFILEEEAKARGLYP